MAIRLWLVVILALSAVLIGGTYLYRAEERSEKAFEKLLPYKLKYTFETNLRELKANLENRTRSYALKVEKYLRSSADIQKRKKKRGSEPVTPEKVGLKLRPRERFFAYYIRRRAEKSRIRPATSLDAIFEVREDDEQFSQLAEFLAKNSAFLKRGYSIWFASEDGLHFASAHPIEINLGSNSRKNRQMGQKARLKTGRHLSRGEKVLLASAVYIYELRASDFKLKELSLLSIFSPQKPLFFKAKRYSEEFQKAVIKNYPALVSALKRSSLNLSLSINRHKFICTTSKIDQFFSLASYRGKNSSLLGYIACLERPHSSSTRVVLFSAVAYSALFLLLGIYLSLYWFSQKNKLKKALESVSRGKLQSVDELPREYKYLYRELRLISRSLQSKSSASASPPQPEPKSSGEGEVFGKSEEIDIEELLEKNLLESIEESSSNLQSVVEGENGSYLATSKKDDPSPQSGAERDDTTYLVAPKKNLSKQPAPPQDNPSDSESPSKEDALQYLLDFRESELQTFRHPAPEINFPKDFLEPHGLSPDSPPPKEGPEKKPEPTGNLKDFLLDGAPAGGGEIAGRDISLGESPAGGGGGDLVLDDVPESPIEPSGGGDLVLDDVPGHPVGPGEKGNFVLGDVPRGPLGGGGPLSGGGRGDLVLDDVPGGATGSGRGEDLVLDDAPGLPASGVGGGDLVLGDAPPGSPLRPGPNYGLGGPPTSFPPPG